MTTKTYINIANKYDRLIVLIDMDCFYCQVEEILRPELTGKPIAVVQYNAWRGGGIIAVNYPARALGVTRHMRGDEAKEHCPEIELVSVPNVREKADLTKYREAGKSVADVLKMFTPMLERASVDEAYLDITSNVVEKMKLMNDGKYRLEPDKLINTFAVGYKSIGEFVQNLSKIVDKEEIPGINEEDIPSYKKSDIKLLIAAAIVNEIRATVKEKTGYECSAGIAHNKILAKFACGINKPNKQTILPLQKIPMLLSDLPINKIKGLGGKFGEIVIEKLKIKNIGDLTNFTEAELQKYFDEKNGSWLYLMSRGIDLECVQQKFLTKSIGCCKKFPGQNAIQGIATLTHWLTELGNEVVERAEKDEIENNRRAKQMTVSYAQTVNGEDVTSSRTVNLSSYEAESIAKNSLDVIKKNTNQFFKTDSKSVLNNPIKFLSLSIGKFENKTNDKKNKIQELFSNQSKKNEEQELTKIKQEPLETTINLECKPEEVASKPKVESNILKNMFEKQVLLNNKNSEINLPPPQETTGTFLTTKTVDMINSEIEKKETTKKSFFRDLATKQKIANSNNQNDDKITNEISDENNISEMENNILWQGSVFNEENDNNQPSTSTDYRNTYVEYYQPPEISEKVFVECQKCNKNILDYELPSHLDFHYALELSDQQRIEYRNEVKKVASSTPPMKVTPTQKKNLKLNVNNNSKGVVKPIDKFLIKIGVNQSENQNTDQSTHETEKCLDCGKSVKITEVFEHQDYHAARKLQCELNNQSIASSNNKKSIVVNDKSKRRKVDSGKGKSSSNISVLSYFNKNDTG